PSKGRSAAAVASRWNGADAPAWVRRLRRGLSRAREGTGWRRQDEDGRRKGARREWAKHREVPTIGPMNAPRFGSVPVGEVFPTQIPAIRSANPRCSSGTPPKLRGFV